MDDNDRLSSLPDELLHKILSCLDMKDAVQTCVLSSRWEFVWASMPCLNFSCWEFVNLRQFSKFVHHVLSHRNHQKDVSSVKLHFTGAVNQAFVRNIANYAFSRNVQQLEIFSIPDLHIANYPPCLFSSQSLKRFELIVYDESSDYITLNTPLDFPALTTMHLWNMTLCGDLFSKCINLKNLTLQDFRSNNVEVLDIIAPRLSNLILINSKYVKGINMVAPQLENLTMIGCSSIEYLTAPPGLVSFSCKGGVYPTQLSKDGFHSLSKVTICLDISCLPMSYKEECAPKFIKMLQEVCSARYLTLNADIIECLSLFPDLLLHHPSPFSNLISLTIDYSMRKKDAYNVNMSGPVLNFLLENSPSAKFILELPKDPSRS